MFCNRKNLVGFRSDFTSLENGREMFINCDHFLGGGITGKSNFWEGPTLAFPNLVDGAYMFQNCRLSKNNVISVLDSLPYAENGSVKAIEIGALGDTTGTPSTGSIDILCLQRDGSNYRVKPEVNAAIDSARNLRNWNVGIHYYKDLGGDTMSEITNIIEEND